MRLDNKSMIFDLVIDKDKLVETKLTRIIPIS